jgi:hypothetical protein
MLIIAILAAVVTIAFGIGPVMQHFIDRPYLAAERARNAHTPTEAERAEYIRNYL